MAPEPVKCSTMTPSTSWLNKDFLQTALRKVYGTPTLNITKFNVKAAVGKGDNYTSDLYRVTVHTAIGKVSNLIVKRELSDNGDLARILRESTAFPREIQMYSTTIVEMARILEEALPGICDPFAARYLYSCPGTIVVQDLCAEGFKMAERRQGLDLSHCLLVMRTLARFHAASVALHSRNPESMSRYEQNFFCEPITQEGLKMFVAGSMMSVAAAVETWPGYGERYAGKLMALSRVMVDRIEECVLRDDSTLNVLNHGDLWVNNMLFRYSGEDGSVVELRFVDFQLPHFTSPAIDLQYFLNTSPSEEVRVHHIDQVMKEYHSTLCDTLDALGYSDKKITLEELWKEYNKKVIYGVHGACCVLPIVLADKGISLDALLESGMEQNFDVYKGEFYKKALQRMLPIFEKKGAFKN